MKMLEHSKGRGAFKANSQQMTYELKHRVVLALNKLADRDTYKIGVEDLKKTIECLNPDGVAPFLSCILDTDSEQKSAVRKECIRLIGTLAIFHEDHIGPYLGKMIASIVKRLKDPDSVVRDACVETVGVLASKMCMHEGENDEVFVVLVKPLFEALGEQNKQVQAGSALCLARAIDNTNGPPLQILQRILTRIIKLLKNPNFMAKPAIIELNRSIIQAGGATTRSTLSAAVTGIQEALKSNDWTTRKAAAASLGELAANGRSVFGSFKVSCLRSLDTCRFDKVKPVRDTVLQALHLWKSLPAPGAATPEPSETGSSTRENFCGGDYGACESASKDILQTVEGNESGKRRIPLSVRKAGHNYVENPQMSKSNDWHIEIAVPRNHNVSLADAHNEESEGSSVTKTFDRISGYGISNQDNGYEYVPMDDKQDCSSVSNLGTDNFEAKLVTVSHGDLKDDGLLKPWGTNKRVIAKEISTEEQRYQEKVQDRNSLDSTVTELSSQSMHDFCLQTANEMVSIQKQLSEIENQQSNLTDLLKMFTASTMDSLSLIQSKVSRLEHVVDGLAQDLNRGGKLSDPAISRIAKKNPSVASPRLSTCTPRPSVDIRSRQPPLLPGKNVEVWEEKAFARTTSNNYVKQDIDMWTDSRIKLTKNPIGKNMHKSSGQGTHGGQIKRSGDVISPASTVSARKVSSEIKSREWMLVKGYLSEGDLESAYLEALSSHEELVLIELLDRTGPVLDSLSHGTASDVLSTLASFFTEQRFMNSIIPWLQQMVELSTIYGPNYIILSANARQDFMSAIQEVVKLEFPNHLERRSITQLSAKMQQIWGKRL